MTKQHISKQIEEIDHLSSPELWSLVESGLGFPATQDERMKALIAQGKKEALTTAEQVDLDQLMELYDQYILLRAKALAELEERGEDVQSYLKNASGGLSP